MIKVTITREGELAREFSGANGFVAMFNPKVSVLDGAFIMENPEMERLMIVMVWTMLFEKAKQDYPDMLQSMRSVFLMSFSRDFTAQGSAGRNRN